MHANIAVWLCFVAHRQPVSNMKRLCQARYEEAQSKGQKERKRQSTQIENTHTYRVQSMLAVCLSLPPCDSADYTFSFHSDIRRR